MTSAGRLANLSKLFPSNVIAFRSHLPRRICHAYRRSGGASFSHSHASPSSPSFSSSFPVPVASGLLSDGEKTTLTTSRFYSTTLPLSKKKAQDISVHFKFADDTTVTVKGAEGDSLLDLVVDNNIDIDGFGACEGTLACSTCHVILSQEDYDRIPDQPTDEEYDMLDLACNLTDTSRLGCQIFLTKDLDNLVVDVPSSIADARS